MGRHVRGKQHHPLFLMSQTFPCLKLSQKPFSPLLPDIFRHFNSPPANLVELEDSRNSWISYLCRLGLVLKYSVWKIITWGVHVTFCISICFSFFHLDRTKENIKQHKLKHFKMTTMQWRRNNVNVQMLAKKLGYVWHVSACATFWGHALPSYVLNIWYRRAVFSIFYHGRTPDA